MRSLALIAAFLVTICLQVPRGSARGDDGDPVAGSSDTIEAIPEPSSADDLPAVQPWYVDLDTARRAASRVGRPLMIVFR